MDPKILTESGWKTAAAKFKIKGDQIQKTLAAYDKLEDDAYEDLLEVITEIRKQATALKKSKDVAAVPAAIKHLADLLSALDSEQRDIAKDKAEADKEEKAKAAEQKAQEEEDEETDEDQDGEEDEEEGEYAEKLLAALKKLKSAKELTYQFIVCEGKPPAVVIAKRITPKHKEEASRVTGSKRFWHVGDCRFDGSHYIFELEKPVSGLAKKLQESLKHHTGKRHPIRVGDEAADSDESTDAASAGIIAPPKLGRAELANAPQVWHGTRDILHKNINALKRAIQAKYAGEDPDFVDEVNSSMQGMGIIIEKLDDRLAHSLEKAHAAKDAAGRKVELANAKGILAEYIRYVKTEPLIEHIDSNPFGVKTNLKAILASTLTHMAQAIG